MSQNISSSNDSGFSFRKLPKYLTKSEHGRWHIFLVSWLGAALAIALACLTLSDLSRYTSEYPELAHMGDILGGLYCTVGGIAGLLNIWLCLVRSDRWKVIAAISLVTSSTLNTCLLLLTSVVHIVYHLKHKAQMISACIRGIDSSLQEDNPTNGTSESVPDYCQRVFLSETTTIAIGLAIVVLYFAIAITLVTVSYYRRLRREQQEQDSFTENITPAPRRRCERFTTFETSNIKKH